MSYMSKFVAALVGVVAMAIATSRQLFLFAVSRDPQALLRSQRGNYHLWLALAAGITACIATALMFHFFNRHEKSKWSMLAMTLTGLPQTSIAYNPSANSPAPIPFDPVRWALANPWLA